MWKDINGFEGLYQVDEYGRVKSIERIVGSGKTERKIHERILKPSYVGKGYQTVCLRKDNKTYRKYIHQMVADCYVPKTGSGYKIINHIDGNKDNNHFENLEWSSYSANNQHAYDTLLKVRGELFYNAKLTEFEVREILANGKCDTYQNIADKYGVSKATVRDVLLGRTWKHVKS